MNKRIISLICAMLLTGTMFGCGNTKNNDDGYLPMPTPGKGSSFDVETESSVADNKESADSTEVKENTEVTDNTAQTPVPEEVTEPTDESENTEEPADESTEEPAEEPAEEPSEEPEEEPAEEPSEEPEEESAGESGEEKPEEKPEEKTEVNPEEKTEETAETKPDEKPEEKVEEKVEETAEDENGIKVTDLSGDWRLILVNPWYKLPDEGFEVNRKAIDANHSVDARIYEDLMTMLSDMRKAGHSAFVCSSYRTYSYQKNLYNRQINQYLGRGYAQKEAEIEAAKWVAPPQTSEHHTGLAVDIVATEYTKLDESQEKRPEQQWLMANSWRYGFILRYPNGKTSITGIYYEPWHYRYVGKEAAKEIYERGITLEEYLGKA